MSYSLPRYKHLSIKAQMKVCYHFIRYIKALDDALADMDWSHGERIIASQIQELRLHLVNHFSLAMRIVCSDMYADGKNDFDRYNDARWLDTQVSKKYGDSLEAWRLRGKLRAKLLNLDDIPF